MHFYDNQPVKIDDTVEVARDARSGYDGCTGTVINLNNMTAIAGVRFRKGYREIHVSKLTIVDRKKEQLNLF